MPDILYGIGVGPGDPDLITLAAVKVLAEVDVVFAPASARNDFSLAQDIVRPHLRPAANLVGRKGVDHPPQGRKAGDPG